jgi:exodeoxyribonuclease-5
MEISQFSQMVVESLGVEPTQQQRALIDALCRFCSKQTPSLSVFLLNGYAGTGKTSVVAALVKSLRAVRYHTVLLAPTGRAAKVLSLMADKKALTIHRKIYRTDAMDNYVSVAGVADNPHRNTLFIVDEASMIGDEEESSLLDDLIQYVYSGEGCRMILVGDTAQLPPVGCSESPAMSVARLHEKGLRVSRAVLTQTVRQTAQSGILYNATLLRRQMKLEQLPVPRLRVKPFGDVVVVQGEDLADSLSSSYSNPGIHDTILITRSNKRAMQFNLAIRQTILEKEEVLSRQEPLLIAKNNYFWTSKIKDADFIANGDIVTVSHIYGTEVRGFLRFADVALTFADRDLTIDAKIILNALTAENAGLQPEHEQQLMQLALNDMGPDAANNPAARARALRTDPYYNALRVKYAYTVTCHKAQGGQWESVYVDLGFIPDEAATTPDFYRWLYTAITRARRRLTLISPQLPID